MMKEIDENAWVTELVTQDYRVADVMNRYGINFCCGGKWPLKAACEARGLDVGKIIAEMNEVRRVINISPATKFADWPLDFLIDYIVHVHHAFLKAELENTAIYLESFVEGHKKKFLQLPKLHEAFHQLEKKLKLHMVQEEELIFSYIKKLNKAYKSGEPYASLLVRTLRKPINDVMNNENVEIGKILLVLRELTNDYQFPENACTSHRVVYMKLKELDMDLVQHLHLENNILFPRAIAMEKELSEKRDS